MNEKRRTFTPEFKFQVVLDLLTGQKRAAHLCREHQISETSLSRWRQEFLDKGPQVFVSSELTASVERARIAELERMVGRLMMELDAAKKVSSWLHSR